MALFPTDLTIRFGNFMYFFFILLLASVTVSFVALSRKYGQKFTKKVILIMIWSNFALHFLKQLNPYYLRDLPFTLTRSTGENLCAVLIMLYPFIYHFGTPHMKDYLYYVGILSGIVATCLPSSLVGLDFAEWETVLEAARYYICHMPLVVCGLLLVDSGIHKLDYHRLWAQPLLFVGVQCIICLNAILLQSFGGWNNPTSTMTWELLFSRAKENFVNASSTFGPPPSVDKIFGWMYGLMIPYLQTYYVDGVLHFTPAIYLIPVLYIYGPLFLFPLAAPYEHRHMRIDALSLRQWSRMKRNARESRKKKAEILKGDV